MYNGLNTSKAFMLSYLNALKRISMCSPNEWKQLSEELDARPYRTDATFTELLRQRELARSQQLSTAKIYKFTKKAS